ncbi:tyrosine-type recombinase/integrase [Bradyrhizobium tropiciagri]|uniref:tyrosine-type recombinase/integrase n=1 Tax=Bradyrhizobium tropiciagri TaxID=312253 RepID=UPI001BA82638|nr:tyrosine-type recombinase/integrase [Bradyrhizobium tropiciagri]MBR0895777.1 tyrosine-type recombinase/integrase [Bradyrhizobium tropiciagri]
MDRKYLVKQYNTYSVVVEVPKPLQAKAGRKRFKKSLGTDSLAEANKRKHFYVADFHRRIAELAKGGSDDDAKLSRLAAEFRQALESSKNVWHEDEEEHEWNEYEEELDRLKAKAREILDKEGSEAAAHFYNAATGQATLLKDQYQNWLDEVQHAGQTKSQHESTIKRFMGWASDSVSIEEVTRKKAGEYVTELMNASGFARATARRHVSSLSSLWRWLKGRGVAGDNPWLGQQLGKKQDPDRKRLSDDALLKLLKGRYSTPKFAQVLSDLLRLALLHGARLEELCALKRSDVHKREDGYWLVITSGKTRAARREIPVHPMSVSIIERRLKDKDEYLFAGLEPGGPDDKRSWYISKAYGRFRDQVGVTGDKQDFHALRHTFITRMEGLEVPESTVKLLVGHSRKGSMTYGHYSKGDLVNLRKAIEKVDYGTEVMKAIAT